MSETVAKLPAKQSAPAMQAGAALRSFNPTTFDEVTRLAKMAVMAGLSGSKDDNQDAAIAKATMAVMQGLELGLPAMQAVQNIAIINGKAMIYGDLLTAVLWSKGFKIEKRIEGTGEMRCGYAKITRPDGQTIEKRFSVADAKRARLWDERDKVRRKGRGGEFYEAVNDSPWYRFPDRMLEWRAFGFCCKDGASDATRGMMVREEMAPEFNEMVDVTPRKSLPGPAQDAPAPLDDVFADQTGAFDVEGLLARLKKALDACRTSDELATAWRPFDAEIEGPMPIDQRERAYAIYDEAEARIEKASA